MAGKIQFDDAFQGDFKKQLQELNTELKEFLKNYRALTKEAKSNQDLLKAAKNVEQLNKAVEKNTTSTKKLTAEEKKLAKAEKDLAFALSEEGKRYQELLYKKQKQNKANRDLAKSQDTAAKSTNRWGVAVKSFAFKFNALGNLVASLAGFLANQFRRAVTNAVNIIKDFDGAQAKLASITGKTRDEISDLTKQAKELGSTSIFTATQVTSLQIELAKLGFTATEIGVATDAVLDFATATGADLAAAAKTAGVAVRAFGLSTTETDDAVATLAVSTTKSALAFEDFETILSTAGPVARSFGFSLEDVVALTAKLRDAGFDASKSGTALRNILLNLADANGALAKELGGAVTDFDSLIDGLVELNNRGVDLNTTLQLTDKRSVAAFNQFLTGAEAARELRGDITDVNDELEEMVERQLDSLPGDIASVKSAWEGLMLAFQASGPLRNVIVFVKDAILQLSNLSLAIKKFNKQTDEDLERSFNLLNKLSNKQGLEFQQILKDYEDVSIANLIANKDEVVARFAEIRNVNNREAAALYSELIRQRKQAHEEEIKAEQDKNERLIKEAEELARKRSAEMLKEQEDLAKLAKYRNRLNEAYAESERLLSELKPPEDIDMDFEGDFFKFFDEETAGDEVKTAIEIAEKLFQIGEAYRNKTKLADDKAAQEKLATQQSVVNSIDGMVTEGLNIFLNSNQRQQDALDARLDAGLISENRYQQEIIRLKKKQDAIEKAQAVFSIGINTAVAAMQVAAQTGVGAAIAVPLVIALGAAQIAAVLSEPVPQYAKGTQHAKGGPSIVGEKGPELVTEPGGKSWLSPGTDTLVDLKRGSRVTPANVTEQFLKYATIANAMEGKANDNTITMLMDKVDTLNRTMRNKPVASSTMTPAGILTATTKGNTTIKNTRRYFM